MWGDDRRGRRRLSGRKHCFCEKEAKNIYVLRVVATAGQKPTFGKRFLRAFFQKSVASFTF
jgi:hypothetical protein